MSYSMLISDDPAKEMTKTVPDYEAECENCGQSPCVTGVDKNEVTIYRSGMCGPCTFGTAKAIDPDWWNESDY